MIAHFTLTRGKREHLIIRMGDKFHIIDVNETLTKEKRMAVLERGCTPAGMQAMGLSGMTIPKSDIQALTVTGCGYQDDVIFYLKKETLAFRFPQACDQREVDDFFRGIPRKMVKTRTRFRRGKAEDWRLDQQEPLLRKWLGIVATVMQVFSCGAAMGVVFSVREPLWIALALLMLLVDFVLYLAFPAYFTLMDGKSYKKYGYRAQVRELGTPMVILVMMLAVRGMRNYTVFFEKKEIVMVAAVCVVLAALLYWRSRECRKHFEYVLLSVVMAALFGGPCLAHVNYLTDLDIPDSAYYEVIDKDYSSGSRSKRYDCTVVLPEGDTVEVAINQSVYEAMEPGDRVPIVISEGGLGLEYAYFDLDTYYGR